METQTEKKLKIEIEIKRFLSLKVIDGLPSFFQLIKELMEFVDRFNQLDGSMKMNLVKDNIIALLNRQSKYESVDMYILLLTPYIENLITISKSKLLLNLKKGCLKQCL
jgi:hypothetical protein